MEKTLKKLLSLAIAVIMVLSLIPAVSAEGAAPKATEEGWTPTPSGATYAYDHTIEVSTEEELLAYGGKFAWHISNLVIYDKPLDVSEFWKPDKCPWVSTKGCTYEYHCFRAGQTKRCGDTLSRPPQSWCYVERREK